MQFFSIARIVGILVMCFSVTLLVPALVALIYGDGGGRAFVEAFLMTFMFGSVLWWFCRNHKQALRAREGFLIVVLFWGVLGGLGAVPFILSEQPDLSLPESIFESFSGLTTTGATVISGLDRLPKAILFYRQFLQWLGGMGLIVLAVAIIPLLGIGGMQLYRAESSGPMEEKALPRVAKIAKLLWLCYIGLTALCALAYWLAGMSVFDAIGHSFSTLSNGGMSTHDQSIGYFDSQVIYVITAIFMLIAGCNFSLHISAFYSFDQKRSILKNYWRNPEFRFFCIIQGIFIVLFSLGLYINYQFSLSEAFSKGALQLSSMSMTSGYVIFDMNELPAYLSALLIFASLLGGCAGSTTGGLKLVRVLVLWLQMKRILNQMIHPNIVQPIKFGNSILPLTVLERIWAFLIAFILVFWGCVFALTLCGLSIFDAIGAVFAALTNAGPGVGIVSQNVSGVPDSGKLVLTFAMFCGRLEVFTLLVILSPMFWRD